jgi:hypothetical protein
MNDNNALQQEFNFRMSLLRLVTNAPFESGSAAPSSESSQMENLFALVSSGSGEAGR